MSFFAPFPFPLSPSFFCCSAKLPALEKKTQKEAGNLSPPFAVGLPPPRSFLFLLLRTWDCPRRGRNSAPPPPLSRSGGKRDGGGRRKRRRWLLGKKRLKRDGKRVFLIPFPFNFFNFSQKRKKHFRARCSFNRFPFRNSLFLDSLKWKKSLV